MSASEALRVEIDADRSRALAARLAGITPQREYFLPRPKTAGGQARVVDFYLAWIAICQQTRTLEGIVAGKPLRGCDYLLHQLLAVLDEDPERFAADALVRITPDQLRAFLSDTGQPDDSTLDRLDERVRQLRELGRHLLDHYQGDPRSLIAACDHRVSGPDGALDRLARISPYADPARKKSSLLLLFLEGLDQFHPEDPENLGLPVDYHLLRVFLRSDALRLDGPRAETLLAGGEMTSDEDVQLRQAGVEIGRVMCERIDLRPLDLLLWMIGRNCCFYDHEPVCRTGPCTLADGCSLRASTGHECDLRCPLDGVCEGSRSARHAAMREPWLDTEWY